MKKLVSMLIACSMGLTAFTGLSAYAENDSSLLFDLNLSSYDGTAESIKATNGSGKDVSNLIKSTSVGTRGTDRNCNQTIPYFTVENNVDSNGNGYTGGVQLDVGTNTNQIPISNDVTFEMWVKFPTGDYTGAYPRFFSWTDGTSSGSWKDPMIAELAPADPYFTFGYSPDGTKRIAQVRGITFDKWHHITFTRSYDNVAKNAEYNVYVDGVNKMNKTLEGLEAVTTDKMIGFGGLVSSGGGDRKSILQHADLKIYSKALSVDEIKASYNSESEKYAAKAVAPIKDSILFDLDLSSYDGSAGSIKAKNGNGADVSNLVKDTSVGTRGTDESCNESIPYFTVEKNSGYTGGVQLNVGTKTNQLPISNDVTFEMWLYTPTVTSGVYPHFFNWSNQDNANSNTQAMYLEMVQDKLWSHWKFSPDGTPPKKETKIEGSFKGDVWQQLTLTRSYYPDGKLAEYNAYVDGVLKQRVFVSDVAAIAPNSMIGFGGLIVGGGNDRKNNMKFADLKIYSKPLDATEVAAAYNSEKAKYGKLPTKQEIYEQLVKKFDSILAITRYSYSNKSLVDEIDALIDMFGRSDGTAKDETGEVINSVQDISGYEEYLTAKDKILYLEPTYTPYDMSKYYNCGNVYRSDGTYGGAAGFPGAFYYPDFISNKTINWKNPWTEGMTENTLTLNGIDYTLKVVDGVSDTNTKVTWMNKESSEWKDFDVTDGKYSSLEFLANTEQGGYGKRKIMARLNYYDEETETWSYEYKESDLNYFVVTTTDGIISQRGSSTGVPVAGENGAIGHISIPVDYNETLKSFSVLNDSYMCDSEGNITNATGNRYNGYIYTPNVYAITLGMPKAEAEKIADAQPAYMPVNMDRYYNKANLFTDHKDKGDNGCFSWGSSVYASKFKAKDYWTTPWIAGMEKNTLSYTAKDAAQAENIGTKFTVKVTDFVEDSLSNTFMSNGVGTDEWLYVNIENANYSAVKVLLSAGGAVDPTKNDTTIYNLYAKLNYSDGTFGYFNSGDFIRMGGNCKTSLPVTSIYKDSTTQKICEGEGGFTCVSIPTEANKTLDSIDILHFGKKLDAETGEVTGEAQTSGFALNILAITGVTTIGNLNELLNAKVDALKDKTLTWQDYEEIGVIEELIPFAEKFDKKADFEAIKAKVIPVDNTIDIDVTMTEGDMVEDAVSKIIAFGKNYHDTEVVTFNINLPDGVVELSDTITIDGVKFPYITVNVVGGNNTVLTTSKAISTAAVSKNVPSEIKNRLPVEARNKVVAIPVNGLSSLSTIWSSYYLGARVYVDGEQQSLARYPDEGYIWVDAEDLRDGKAYNPDFEGWMTGDANVWHESYLGNKYATVRFYSATIDSKNCTIGYTKTTTNDDKTTTTTQLTLKKDDRYSVSNIPEALNKPGEYYIDKANNVIYYYPTKDLTSATISVDLGQSNAMNILNCVNVNVKNVAFKNINDIALKVNKSENIAVEGCKFVNVGSGIINTEANTANMKIEGNYFNNIGGTSVSVTGGDDTTLTPSGNKITNNLFEDISTYVKTYAPAIDLYGVGHEASDNTIRKSTSNAIKFQGAKNLITRNKIFDVCRETSDSGAIYSGRNMTWLGNEISYNHIENVDAVDSRLHGASPNVRAGIYLDDRLCGTIVHHNYVKNTDRGVQSGGGSFNTIYDNVFVDCVEAPIAIGSIGNDLQIKDPEAEYYDTITADALKVFAANPIYNEVFPYTATMGTSYNSQAHGNKLYGNVYTTDYKADKPIIDGALTDDSSDSTKITDVAAALTEKGITPASYGATIEAQQSVALTYPLNNAADVDPTSTLFKWTSVPASTNYVVEFSETNDFAATVKTVETRNAYAQVTDIPDTAKYWRVVAKTADGDVTSEANGLDIRYTHSIKSVILKDASGEYVKDLAAAKTLKVTLSKDVDAASKIYAGFYKDGALVKCITLTNGTAVELTGVENSDKLSIFVFGANQKPLAVNNVAID